MSRAEEREGPLSLTERGRALAALRLLGPIAAAARLRAPEARRHLERLCDPAARADEEQALSATVPAHLDRVDGSWYEPPPKSRSAPAQRYLDRVAYGRLVAMEASAAPNRGPRAMAAVEPLLSGPLEPLLAALLILGRRRVAIAFTGAPRSALAQLLARIGEPEASRLAAEVRGIPPGVSAEEVKAAQRALFRSGPAPLVGEPAELFFQRVGAGWLAPLSDRGGDSARRLAQRLPRGLGEIILRERATLSEPERASLLRLCATLPSSTTSL